MRRAAVLLVLLVAVLGVAATGCGGEQEQSATPETTEGSIPTPTETTDTEPTEVEGDPAAGKVVFTGASGCGGCHTLADAGATGTVGPNLDETKPSYDLVLDRVTNGLGSMPAFQGTLSEEEIQDVSAYISTAAGQ